MCFLSQGGEGCAWMLLLEHLVRARVLLVVCTGAALDLGLGCRGRMRLRGRGA